MRLTVLGSGDAAGIPVQGCSCSLCRQARAVRHLRRRPTSLLIQEGNERLLLQAGNAEQVRNDWQDPPSAVLLSSWQPPHWAGLIPLHLGAGPEVPVYGPAVLDHVPWLAQQHGRLVAHASLRDDQPLSLGRFQIRPFALDPEGRLLAYGIITGEQRLLFVPQLETLDTAAMAAIASWAPQAAVLDCPSTGRPNERLARVAEMHRQCGRPALLLTGIDHRMDQWLQQQAPTLPPGIRLTRDDQRLDIAYLNEHRRLDSALA